MKRVDHAIRYRLKAATRWLPPAAQRKLARRRHVKHVSVNMTHLTHEAFLGQPSSNGVDWIDPSDFPSLPESGFGIEPLNAEQVMSVREWIRDTNLDDDAMLERRMDNHNDELGRTRAALRTRVAIGQALTNDHPQTPSAGDRILFDARSLQSAAFGQRGIGRFAASALQGLRLSAPDTRIDLLIDAALEELPDDVAGNCTQVRWVDSRTAGTYGLLIQPSPMTSDPEPLVSLLQAPIRRVAVVFDFIPLHYPDVYLAKAPMRAEYLSRLDALRCFTDFVCISNFVAQEVEDRLGVDPSRTRVAWPKTVHAAATEPAQAATHSPAGPILILTGDEARKNTFGALAAAGAATADEDSRDVLVMGMAGQGTRVHHWSIAAMMRPGEATTLERIPDEEMLSVLQQASVAVVASFDEGLSLPVIEALYAGVPVVASDIPAHRELIGGGDYLVDPGNIRSLTRAIRRQRGRSDVRRKQAANLHEHQHEILEEVIADRVEATHFGPPPGQAKDTKRSGATRVALVTPWPPQKTGIADFSAAIGRELAKRCDLTVVTTSDAHVGSDIPRVNVDEILANPEEFRENFDAIVVVIGNSHFHLPFLETLRVLDAVVVAHDTRMTEVYMALRASHGVIDLMTRGQRDRRIRPSLDDQIDDMRLLQNTGMWEVAHQSKTLVMHSPSAAPRIEQETGVPVTVLPFANYRFPDDGPITPDDRLAARKRLGFSQDAIHLATFGYVDTRTKLTDQSLEVAGWLQDWGHPIHFHVVGAASSDDAAMLTARADKLALSGFTLTGYADEATYRDYLLAIDCGIQLRVSPLLGVSGPLADLAAFGTPAVASRGLFVDVGCPANVHPLPDFVSPVTAAQAIEQVLAENLSNEQREEMRLNYLATMSAAIYAEQLMDVLDPERERGTS